MCSIDNFHGEDVNMKWKALVKLVTFKPSGRSFAYDPSRKMRFLSTKYRNFGKSAIPLTNPTIKKSTNNFWKSDRDFQQNRFWAIKKVGLEVGLPSLNSSESRQYIVGNSESEIWRGEVRTSRNIDFQPLICGILPGTSQCDESELLADNIRPQKFELT